jgi:hypothetical protein
MQRWFDMHQTKLFAAKCKVKLFHAVSSFLIKYGRGGVYARVGECLASHTGRLTSGESAPDTHWMVEWVGPIL